VAIVVVQKKIKKESIAAVQSPETKIIKAEQVVVQIKRCRKLKSKL
jgi:hypothetical protein